jgi:hypothetical protein
MLLFGFNYINFLFQPTWMEKRNKFIYAHAVEKALISNPNMNGTL